MMAIDNNKIIVQSLIWKTLERVLTQFLKFGVQVVLARILFPEDFGNVAIILAFVNVANIFIQRGFLTSLVQKESVSSTDYSSVFYLTLIISVVFYLVLFMSSPMIANIYKYSSFKIMFRYLGIILLFSPLQVIQISYMYRNMMFKQFFMTSLISTILSGTIGIIMALHGYGVWSLITLQIIDHSAIVISRIVTVRIQLRLIFSYEKVKELFRFGYKILLASLLNSFYTSYRTLFIGLYYDSESLGYFNRGEEIPRISANTIDGSIQAVMLPTYSKLQNDQIKLKSLLRKSIRMSTYIVIPMMFILAVVSEDLVMLLLTEKWINSSIFMSIFSISFAFRPIYSSNREAITAIGRSDVYLRITIIQLLVSVLLLAITLQINLVVAAIGLVISEIFSCILTGYYVYRLLSYKFSEQLKDITKNLFVGILMLTSLHFFRNYFIESQPLLVNILLTSTIGVIIYLSLSVLFMRNDFFQDLRYFADIIRSR